MSNHAARRGDGCAVRGSDADARLLGALCVVPQFPAMYTMLPIGTMAQTARQMSLLVVVSLVGEAAKRWYFGPVRYEDLVRTLLLWPAAGLVCWNARVTREAARR